MSSKCTCSTISMPSATITTSTASSSSWTTLWRQMRKKKKKKKKEKKKQELRASKITISWREKKSRSLHLIIRLPFFATSGEWEWMSILRRVYTYMHKWFCDFLPFFLLFVLVLFILMNIYICVCVSVGLFVCYCYSSLTKELNASLCHAQNRSNKNLSTN